LYTLGLGALGSHLSNTKLISSWLGMLLISIHSF
jgi:hypothetical protein